jgi:hypothetical protein
MCATYSQWTVCSLGAEQEVNIANFLVHIPALI